MKNEGCVSVCATKSISIVTYSFCTDFIVDIKIYVLLSLYTIKLVFIFHSKFYGCISGDATLSKLKREKNEGCVSVSATKSMSIVTHCLCFDFTLSTRSFRYLSISASN